MALVSFKHRFAFIKTTKTAGTSIEIDLSQKLEDTAIVTPILPPVDGHVARNFNDASGAQQFKNHMSALQIRNRIGADVFDGMFTFCVEREPVEKCISHFHMLRNSPLHNPDGSYQRSWQEYCEDGKFPIDFGKYSAVNDGAYELVVDRVLRYQDLHWELPVLLEELGISGFDLSSKAKSEYSRNTLVRKEDVTPAQRALIYDKFAPMFEITGLDWS